LVKIAENKGFPVILLTTNLNGNMLAGALRYFSQPRNYEGLAGNIMIYRQPGQVHSLEMRDGENVLQLQHPMRSKGDSYAFGNYTRKN